MQKLDRLSKLGIVAIVVLVVFGGAGIWWWSTQPVEPAKADPPPTLAATPTPRASSTSPTPSVGANEDPETAAALKAYVSYEEALEQTARDGGLETNRQALIRITTPDGPERERAEDLLSQVQDGKLRLLNGRSKMVRYEVTPTTSGPDELAFTVCWDGRSLEVEGSTPIPFLNRMPIMRKSDGQWLVHDVQAEQVAMC